MAPGWRSAHAGPSGSTRWPKGGWSPPPATSPTSARWPQFDATDWDRESFARHVEVNLLGLNTVLAEVVPPFVRRGSGHVVGVASVAGDRGLPGAEAYGATKSARITLLEVMRASLHRKGVRVTTVCPGFVRTDMTAANALPMPFIVEPEELARATVDGLEAGRAEIVFLDGWPC